MRKKDSSEDMAKLAVKLYKNLQALIQNINNIEEVEATSPLL
ncbi:hypothetical protein V4B17_04165 [Bartonella sp. B23]